MCLNTTPNPLPTPHGGPPYIRSAADCCIDSPVDCAVAACAAAAGAGGRDGRRLLRLCRLRHWQRRDRRAAAAEPRDVLQRRRQLGVDLAGVERRRRRRLDAAGRRGGGRCRRHRALNATWRRSARLRLTALHRLVGGDHWRRDGTVLQ